jgi:hypothetical protein
MKKEHAIELIDIIDRSAIDEILHDDQVAPSMQRAIQALLKAAEGNQRRWEDERADVLAWLKPIMLDLKNEAAQLSYLPEPKEQGDPSGEAYALWCSAKIAQEHLARLEAIKTGKHEGASKGETP